MSRVPLTEAQWRRVAEYMRDAGLPKKTIDMVREAFNVAPRPKWRCLSVDDALRSRVCALRQEGLSQRQIAQRVGRGKGTVQYVLRQLQQLQ